MAGVPVGRQTSAAGGVGAFPAAPFFGPFNSECVRGQPILYGYSPAVIPPPADWGADVHVTGYWFLDPAEDWTPDAALADFLAAGPPPVYVGFGRHQMTAIPRQPPT